MIAVQNNSTVAKQYFLVSSIFICTTGTILLLRTLQFARHIPTSRPTGGLGVQSNGVASLDVNILFTEMMIGS
jgi:hypothetical protein